MKQTQDFEGKNIEEAIDTACSALNISKKKLSYDVISTGSSGIFGIVGVKKAKIRVTLPQERGRDTSELDAADMDGIMSMVDEAFGEPRKAKAAGAEAGAEPGETGADPEQDRDAAPGAQPQEKKQGQPRKRPPRNRHQDKPRQERKPSLPRQKPAPEPESGDGEETAPPETAAEPRAVEETASPAAVTPETVPDAPDETPADLSDEPVQDQDTDDETDPLLEEEEIDEWEEGFPPKYKDEVPVDVPEHAVKLGVETLQKIVDLITSDAAVEAETDQDRLLLKVKGGNSGVLIGRRGQTMEAMQFITDKIINRSTESRVRLRVDVEGYMETRKANLISLAHKMADKAKKTGKPATINQMTAQDRRTVHLALKDDTGVRTQSMGDGYYRRLVIFPKKGAFKKRRPPKK